ncbi:alpha-ketoglutarate-dependent dioxygenase AlkB [Chitinophaga ginsengisegetis]|uniref:alpha-ketoglutarate-dependent dioxygenase AlkB family protein n=1 Tax=Chitinophaga ginsengisegetis TaxID=393003 RepID=UPI000DB990ED|nr:alpha-ketoglutarate-dependent dioxygenase AlkB [Chitinophaga ginsengisegetis]MDR6566308.1 alkylated DNA repair dioxygenase AlkB [Chitinophaga ginsengisegetis]MDR6646038.1 alkylated DNA repair dioxygenase AlkB [Chitinophaga ginsengisegetis]MDR6651370.1 alkylated DNA repair dioxygenase AlkB [Chitinophaga ginsengisegetis]
MSVQGSFFNEEDAGKISLLNGELAYYPQFFNLSESNHFMQVLQDTITWKQESMKIYGKEVLFPRLMAWYGDAASSYGFSGNIFSPEAWTAELQQIRDRITPVSGQAFNSVLLNLYRNGNDSMGWHADDEPELGRNPVIASVNFGATRRFQLRYKSDHQRKYELSLQHGSLLVMKGPLQEYWEHQVPKTTKISHGRINLTFRFIHP